MNTNHKRYNTSIPNAVWLVRPSSLLPELSQVAFAASVSVSAAKELLGDIISSFLWGNLKGLLGNIQFGGQNRN